MRPPPEIAQAHADARLVLVDAASNHATDAWSNVDPDHIVESWTMQLPDVLAVTQGAQLAAARDADGYLDEVLDAQGVSTDAVSPIKPAAFVGDSGGGELAKQLYQPVISSLLSIGSGATVDDALAHGRETLRTIVRTQVADAGRNADHVAMAARPAADGYIRVVVGPTCSRCTVLAGHFYQWNTGFQRHPRCDCVHLPANEAKAGHLIHDPHSLYESLTPKQRLAAGWSEADQRALREGADIFQVTNAHRGVYVAGGRRFTTEGTTKRGFARSRLGKGKPRLTPAQIYADAATRDEALQELYRNGYLLKKPAPVTRQSLDLAAAEASPPAAAGAAGSAARVIEIRPELMAAKSAKAVGDAYQAEMARVTGRPVLGGHFSGSVQTAREHAEGLLRAAESFPDAAPGLVVVGRMPNPTTYAITRDPGDITFSAHWSAPAQRRGYLEQLKKNVDDHWHPAGMDSPAGIAIHEMGHVLDLGKLGGSAHARIEELVAAAAARAGVSAEELVGSQISRYALKNTDELVAEAYTDVMANGPAASQLSRDVFDALRSEYERAGLRFVATAPAATVPVVPASKMTLTQLRAAAKERGLRIPAGSKKADIVRLLEAGPATREAAIKAARGVADIATDMHELVGNQASVRALQHRLAALSKRTGVDTTRLAALADDPEALLRAVDEMAAKAGLTRIGDVGTPASFDRKLHATVAGAPEAGELVGIVRPGFTAVLPGGEEVQLARADVRALSAAEQQQARRAATRAAARARNLEIERRQKTADLLAEVDELIAKKAAPAVFEERFSMADIDAKDLAALRAAGGNATKLRAAVTRIGRREGITPVAKAGAKAKFDPALHEPVGAFPPDGSPVVVIRRGSAITINGETLTPTKALVKQAPAPAKKVVAPKATAAAGRASAAQVRQTALRDLAEQTPTDTRRLGGGYSAYTNLLSYRNGDRLVEKIYGERLREGLKEARYAADAEQLGAEVLSAVGGRAPATHRLAPGRIAMEWIEGPTAAELGISEYGSGIAADIIESDDARLMGLADVLMGNTDRNTGNWIRTADGRLVGIDHGSSFPDADPFAGANNPFSQYLVDIDRVGGTRFVWAANDLSKEDLAIVRARLEALKPQFVEARRTGWHSLMMRRLKEIEKRATGTRNRIAP